MKTGFFLFLLTGTITFFSSCTRSNDDLRDTSQAQNGTVTSGTWRVSLFTDSGKDETSDFAGYSFRFNTNGALSATTNNGTKNGTWNINSSSQRFNIDLGAKTDSNKPVGELTDDWKILSISSTQIKLTDDNPASNEFLTFTKN